MKIFSKHDVFLEKNIWLWFFFVLVLYIFFSISALFVSRWLISSTPGNLSRWLAYGTIVQAVVASAPIVAMTAILVIYTGRTEKIFKEQTKIFKEQTSEHERMANTGLASKIEGNITVSLSLMSDLRSTIDHIICIYRTWHDLSKSSENSKPGVRKEILKECSNSLLIMRKIAKRPDLAKVLSRHLFDILTGKDKEATCSDKDKEATCFIKKIAKIAREKIEASRVHEAPLNEVDAFFDIINIMDIGINKSKLDIGINKSKLDEDNNKILEIDSMIPALYLYPSILILKIMPEAFNEYINDVINNTVISTGDGDKESITKMVPVLASLKSDNSPDKYKEGIDNFFAVIRTINMVRILVEDDMRKYLRKE